MKISIMEVGPRDGLQNASGVLSFDQKRNLIQTLLDKGFQNMEAGSFVRGDLVPAMSNTDKIAQNFLDEKNRLWYLVPNLAGLKIALKCGVTQLAFFTATSEAFNKKNIGMGVEESLAQIRACITYLKDQGYGFVKSWEESPDEKKLKLRLYVSTVIACPYAGKMDPFKTIHILGEMASLPFVQFSLGDTLGMGVPKDWKKLLKNISWTWLKKNRIAMHCHDTYGTGLACVAQGLEAGVLTFDSSIGGLGGCPFAKGATGNLATEDLVYFLEKEGLGCDVRLDSLMDIFDASRTGPLKNQSRVWKALSGLP